jgi:SulP family sulfate permease
MRNLQRWFPFLRHTASYRAHNYAMDVIAGLIIAVVLVPEAIAYSHIAGLPPEVGLYTAIIAYLTYALFGPSRQLVVAPVSIISLMVGVSLGQEGYNPSDYLAAAVILSLLVAIILFLMGFFKAGCLENLLSKPVQIGFITAGALIVATTQLPHLLGLEIHAVAGPLKTLDTLYQSVRELGGTDWVPLLIGVTGIVSIQLSKRISPFVPGALLNLALGVAILYLVAGLDSGRVEIVGTIPAKLPSFALPWSISGESFWQSLESVHITKLLSIAPAIALVNFVESISIAKVMSARNGDRVEANRELMALGAANFAASFFGAYPAAGSLSKTSVSFQAGARSQVAGIVAVIAVMCVLLFLTPYLYYVPKACLAAIVFVAAWHLLEWRNIARAFKLSRSEGWIIVATFVLTLLLGVDYGVLAGIVISFALFIIETARPEIYRLGKKDGAAHIYARENSQGVRIDPDELVLKIDAPIFFVNANNIEQQLINILADNPGVRRVIIDVRGVTNMDLSGEKLFWDLLRTLMLRECDLALVGITKPVEKLMKASGFYDFLGPELFFLYIQEAHDHLRGMT